MSNDDNDQDPGASSGTAAEPSGLTPAPAADDDLQALRRERDELKDQVLRRRAEFENYKRRSDRDRQLASVDAAAAVLKAIVPVLDNFDRALEAQGDEAALRQGVALIRKELGSALESQGVVSEDPLGQPFDPERHQALSHEPVPGYADGVVGEVFRKGYVYKDRLLRPALVKVAKDAGDGGHPEAIH
jgi:molecular chaperone GrpE